VQAEHHRGRLAGFYNDKLKLKVGLEPSDAELVNAIKEFGEEIAKVIGAAL
jgi:hypothetical protein